ncbi:hypothetical protein RLOatenuis_5800 [Rickettsiales bacterium]|nr:hypothetical protein RLOatenuis_5800 [Rickettsiales bacterium]
MVKKYTKIVEILSIEIKPGLLNNSLNDNILILIKLIKVVFDKKIATLKSSAQIIDI